MGCMATEMSVHAAFPPAVRWLWGLRRTTTSSPNHCRSRGIPFPRFLMEDSLADLSNDAKVLYALMLDRASISKVNGFIEADGTIRLYFTVEQAQKKLHRSRQCVTRIFRELEYSGLICRKKQGLGKPALITLNYPSNAKLIRPKEAGENLSG